MNIKNILVNILIVIGLSSCGMTTYSKNDSRFALILGKEVHVKRPLYLYEISPNLNGDSTRYPIRSAEFGPADLITVLGAGHPVVFEAVKTSRDLGSYSQHLVGHTEVKSRRYPIIYFIGIGGDDWKIGFNNSFVSPLFKAE